MVFVKHHPWLTAILLIGVMLAFLSGGVGRLLIGLIILFMLPGYVLQAALFLDRLDGIEQIALSIGLSLALVPLSTLLIEYGNGKIEFWTIIMVEGSITTLFAIVAWYRRRGNRQTVDDAFNMSVWWGKQDRTNRLLYAVLSLAFLVFFIAALLTAYLPHPAEQFTEFYLLNIRGTAEDFPRNVPVSQAVTLQVGVNNQEAQPSQYRIEVFASSKLIGAIPLFTLAAGETLEQPITFTPDEVGTDVPITLTLYRNQSAYRSLRLFLTVEER